MINKNYQLLSRFRQQKTARFGQEIENRLIFASSAQPHAVYFNYLWFYPMIGFNFNHFTL